VIPGYLVEYGADVDGPHMFCGPQRLAGGECPNCRKPLLRFLDLDTTDPALQPLGTISLRLPLLFCWTCAIAQEELFYRLTDGGVELVRYGEGGVQTDFPYEDYPVHFPGCPARLEPLTEDEQEVIRRINRGQIAEWDVEESHPRVCRPRHQVGGEPLLVQRDPEAEVLCPECGGPMPFLAAVADDCLDPRGFTGNSYVQVLFRYCIRCRVVGAYQECD
jgi:hypothetical protein